jgi:LysR family transcriptional activator of nhaA
MIIAPIGASRIIANAPIAPEPTELLARLAVHELDVVSTDSPASAETGVRAFNHLLGECTVSIVAPAEEASQYRRGFPESLDNAPML